MKKKKVTKILYIRIPEDLHTRSRVQAAKEKKSLQIWVTDVIAHKLNSMKTSCRWLCEACGHWEIKGSQLLVMRKCDECKKDDVLTFPCWEKIE